ncbi:MAG: phytanoyl-CoA dioxygenase family protein [Armatimonadetes bacterium]|nr:phytanoyl-CoA dioxygenase family protein [Armatimonadota bacterium]
MVTEANVRQYREEGYTLVPELLAPREIEWARSVVDLFIDEHRDQRPEHLDKPHFVSDELLQVCSMPTLLDAVEKFIGPNIALFSSHIIAKAKGDGLAVPWHQDGIFWDLEPMNVITLWLAIDDSTVENGCMRVIPNTQNVGPLPHYEVEHPETKVLHLTLGGEHVDEAKAVDCVLPAGGCSFHAPYLIHGSAPNFSQSRRCGYTMRFMPTSTKLRRDGPYEQWFRDHKLYLVRGEDRDGVNDYVNAPRH